MARKEPETRVDDQRGDDEVIPFRYSISSYGADYPVDGLVKRIQEGAIYIPQFQRGFVWKLPEASRFIESLLLGLPVPAIFLAKEQPTGKLLVIDGQQRLRTLQYFYEGVFADTGRQFALKGVQSQFQNATYKSLSDEDKRRLADSIIHAIVVKQDEPSDDQSSVYYIFERLNSGGVLLNDQEIRAALYHGQFAALLHDMNKNQAWRELYGPVNARMRDQELILRFLALRFHDKAYARPMKEFLNSYIGANRDMPDHVAEELSEAFSTTVATIRRCLGAKAFKPNVSFNAAAFDSIMIGISRRLEKKSISGCAALKRRYDSLLKSEHFMNATQRATADEENVKKRIALATEAFADI
jgi:hypothetical protein